MNPAPRSIRSMPGPPGSSDSYRQSVRGPDSACLRNTSPSIDCRSYVGSSGPKHSSQIVSGSTAYCWPHSRHCKRLRGSDLDRHPVIPSPRRDRRTRRASRTSRARRSCSEARAPSTRRDARRAWPRRPGGRSGARPASITIWSPSSISAIGPPTNASGAMWPTRVPLGRAAEAPVRDQRDVLAQSGAGDRRRDREHLGHAGRALRPLVADHDDVAGRDACRP